MTGGLLQLISSGSQDKILTLNPEFTFFKKSYYRYTNFSKFSNKINLVNKPEFNKSNTILVPKNGDLLDNIYLSIKLPSIQVLYERNKFHEIYNYIKNNSIKSLNITEYRNLDTNIKCLIDYINNNINYKLIHDVVPNNIINMDFGILNTNLLVVKDFNILNNNLYFVLDNVLKYVDEFNLDSDIFFNFNMNNQKMLNQDIINYTEFTFNEILLNLNYSNNFTSLLNYFNFKKSDNFMVNTINIFIEKIYFKLINKITKSYYNLKSINYLQFNNFSKTNILDYNIELLGTNLIEIEISDNLSNNTSISDYDLIFIISSTNFNKVNILSILKKNKLIENFINSKNILYELLNFDFDKFKVGSKLANYIDHGGWVNNSYTITSYNNDNNNFKYILELDNYDNIELNQILFGFETTVNSTCDYAVKVINITDSNIEVIKFENKLVNKNDNMGIYYLSLGFIDVDVLNNNIYKSDIWNNYIYLSNLNSNLLNYYSDLDFQNEIKTLNENIMNIQYILLKNLVNMIFQNNNYIHTLLNIDQTTGEVETFFETSYYTVDYTKFINQIFLKDSNFNQDGSLYFKNTDTPILFKILKFYFDQIDIYKNNSITNFGINFINSLNSNFQNTSILVNYLNYYLENIPFIYIKNSKDLTTYYNYNSDSDSGKDIALGDILYLYADIAKTELLGILIVTKITGIRIGLTLQNYSDNFVFNNSIPDNSYLFKDQLIQYGIQINGNFIDETILTVSSETKVYVNYTTNINTTTNIEIDDVINFYNTLNISENNFVIQLKVSNIVENNITFYLESKDDIYTFNNSNTIESIPKFNIDNGIIYYGFKVVGGVPDQLVGLKVTNIINSGRYFSTDTVKNEIIKMSTVNRGYIYTNIFYNYLCIYIYDLMKSTTNTSLNSELLIRVFYVSSKIHQLISLNSDTYNKTLEPLTVTSSVKFTCYANYGQIISSKTILNEIFNNFNETDGIKDFLEGKESTEGNTYINNAGDLFNGDLQVTDFIEEIKTYFLNQISDEDNKILSIIKANDIMLDEYLNLITNLYSNPENIGIEYYNFVNSDSTNRLNVDYVKSIIELNIPFYNKIYYYDKRTDYLNYLSDIYIDTSKDDSYVSQLSFYNDNKNLLDVIDLDFKDDIFKDPNELKNDIYNLLNLSETTTDNNYNEIFTNSVNEIFTPDEVNNTLFTFLSSTTENNEVYKYINKFIFSLSINQINNLIGSYIDIHNINNLINSNTKTLDEINNNLVTKNKEKYVFNDVYYPINYNNDFIKKLNFISSLSNDQLNKEEDIWNIEKTIINNIKDFYLIDTNQYRSINDLENSINTNVLNTTNYKFIRGAIVTTDEYNLLNYDYLKVKVIKVDKFGGIEKIKLPFNISNIWCNHNDSAINLNLTNPNINITSNNNPLPGNYDNLLGITDNNFNFNLPIRFGKNLENKTINENNDIGISINGIILKNYKIKTSPDGTLPPDNFNLNLLYYYDEFDNKDSDYDAALDTNNYYNYYSGKYILALSNITNDYLDKSNYNGNKIRHTDGHSKIVGMSYDGYPIYGPFGYSDPGNISNIKRMVSSYKLVDKFADNRPPINLFGIGSLVEDFEYVKGLGDLDVSNGRFCVTPEFPNGTYAYFLTLENILFDDIYYLDNPTDEHKARTVLLSKTGNADVNSTIDNLLVAGVKLINNDDNIDVNTIIYIDGGIFDGYNFKNQHSDEIPVFPYIIGDSFNSVPLGEDNIENINIVDSDNLNSYNEGENLDIFGGKGKLGKVIFRKDINNINYLELLDSGLFYENHQSVFLLKEIPDNLEFIDEYKFFLRRKSRFYGGIIYDFGNKKLSIIDYPDSGDYINSLLKLNSFNSAYSNFKYLNDNNNFDIIDTNLINILNLDEIVLILGTLGSDIFNFINKSNLDKIIELDNNSYFDIIDSIIVRIYDLFKNEYKVYYSSELYYEKDNTLLNLDISKFHREVVTNTEKDNLLNILEEYKNNLEIINSKLQNYENYKENTYNRDDEPKYSWIGNVGDFIIDNIELYFNDLLIDKQYSHWVNIWNQLNNSYDKLELNEKIIGNLKSLTELNNNILKEYNIIYPFKFWFCRYTNQNIPLIAIPNVDIQIKFKINSLNNLIRKPEGTKVVFLSELDIYPIANYIYLDDFERKKFAESRHEYLIEQIQYLGMFNLNSQESEFDIYMKNNVKDIYWFTRLDKSIYERDLKNYSINDNLNSGNPILNSRLIINNIDIFNLDGNYTNYVKPYESYLSTPSDGINVYNFSLNNYENQPSGSFNFSMVDNIKFNVQIDEKYNENDNKLIYIYANSYNILRIMSGLAGLAFLE